MTEPLRILLLSTTRPSRAWRVANRLEDEIVNAEICGIIQQPLRRLPQVERVIAARGHSLAAGPSSRVRSWFDQSTAKAMHSALWFVHGCPSSNKSIITTNLAAECQRSGWPFLLADPEHWRAAEFLRRQKPDLVVMLGQSHPRQERLPVTFDLIRAVRDDLAV